MIRTNNFYWSIITTTLIARLIFKTTQSLFLLKTLKTLRERLAIVRKIVDHYRKFLKLRIKSQNRNQKYKSKSKIELEIENQSRNRKSKTEIENRQPLKKSKIDNRKSKKKFQSVSHSNFDHFFKIIFWQSTLIVATDLSLVTTLIAWLICKTIQSIFSLKTLRERLAIVRKIID